MAIAYAITQELRMKLKKPLGRLIRGSFAATMNKFRDILRKENVPIIISVGDTVSRNLFKSHMKPRLSIIDNKCMRRRIRAKPSAAMNTVYVENPQGTITEEAITAIREALDGGQYIQIVVNGEEDLLALIAVVYAPENSVVVYGQPYEGIVVVRVTPEKKKEVREILKAMEIVRKPK